jgi:serine/threonine protein kinase
MPRWSCCVWCKARGSSPLRLALFLPPSRLLASVRHPGIVQYHEAFVDGAHLCLVMELMDGDLGSLIK